MILYNSIQINTYNPNFSGNKVCINKIRQDLEAGKKISEIARTHNISERTVSYIREKFNLPNKKEIIKQKLNETLPAMVNETVSLKTLSEQTGFSIYAIKKWITEHLGSLPKIVKKQKVLEALHTTKTNKEIAEELNIPLNSVKSLRYKHKEGNILRKKQECLKKILELKETGLSGRKIAKKLNIHNSTVCRLLKQYRNNELVPN